MSPAASRTFCLVFEIKCEFAAHRRFARALQSAHHIDCRGLVADFEFLVFAAHKSDQFLVDDFDNLLGGSKRFEHILTERLFADRIDKILDDRKVDVRFKQRDADFSHCLFYFQLRKLAFVAKLGEYVIHSVG